MRTKASIWFWHGVWGVSLLVGLGVFMLYAWLPADGATGDLASFTPEGFRVQWLLEEREGGLRVGDVIVRAGGHTVDEWLEGAPRGPEWRTGGVVIYQTVRGGQPMTLEIQLAPVPFRAILVRWAPQLAVALALLLIGAFVFWKRPQELTARLLMLFCVAVALQYWGDAYNFQYSTLPWRWPLWLHLAYEHGMYSLSIATGCYFALVFPVSHPLVERFPRLAPFVLYAFYPLVISGATVLSPGWNAALEIGNRVSWVITMIQTGVAIGAGIRSARIARDPVTRAQVRWILWSIGIGVVVLIPGYTLPLMLGGRPLFPHPVIMIFIALIPFSLAIAILRYRLFDIEIIINRTLVYGTLTALLAGLYLLLVRLLTLLIQEVLQRENDTLVVFVATLSIALAFLPLRQRVQALIDRAFYRTKLDYQRLLPEMSERLATSIVPGQLAALLTEELPQRLQIAWATLAVLDREGERFVLAGAGESRPTLPVDHPLITYLHPLGRPLLRLQPPPQLPAEAQAFLDQHSIELSIPLIVGTELVGLYNLGPKLSGDAYNRYEVRLLHLLGQQAAVAVENSRLFQAEREQRRLTETLQEAAAVVSSTLDLDQVLDCILEQVSRVVPNDATNIMLIEGDQARIVRWHGYERFGAEEFISTLVFHIPEVPGLQQMVESGEPMVIPDTVTYPDWVHVPVTEWLRSYAAAPIVVRGEVIGFLSVDSATPGFFTQAHAEALRAFADHAAAAIENARLYEAEQERRNIAETLRQASAVLSSTLELDEVLGLILQQLQQVIPYDTTSVQLLQDGRLEILACQGFEEPDKVVGLVFPLDSKFPNYRVVTTKASLAIEDVVQDYPHFKDEADTYESGRIRSWLGAPLMVKDQVIGMIALDRAEVRPYTAEEAQLAMAFANQAAIAIENARLYRQTQEQLKELRAFQETTSTLQSSLDLQEALDRIVRAVVGLGYKVALLTQYDEETNSLVVQTYFIDPILLKAGEALAGTKMMGAYVTLDQTENLGVRMSLAGEIGITHSLHDLLRPVVSAEVCQIAQEMAGVRTLATIPLLAKGRLVGNMFVGTEREEITESELDSLRAFANQAAQARLRELSALTLVGEAINRALSLEETLDIVLREAMGLVGREEGSIILLDPKTNTMRIAASRGLPPEAVEAFNARPVYAHEGTFGIVMETGEMLEMPNPRSDSRVLHDVGHVPEQLTNVPLRTEEGIIGVIALDALPPDDRARRLLLALGDLAAIAIRRARLFEETSRRAEELRLLFEATRDVSASLELDEVLERIAAHLCWAAEATSGNIMILDESGERATVRTQYWSPEASLLERTPDIGAVYDLTRHPAILKALQENRPLVTHADDPNLEPATRDMMADFDGRSALRIPMHVTGVLRGYALIWDSRRRHEWTDEEMRLCQTLANQAAVAIENARLYEQAQQEIVERKRAEAIIKQLAYHDDLTGLPNRRLFNDRLNLALAHAHRNHQKLALMLLDLDHFKDVNDTLGHSVGDLLLQVVGDRLTSLLRKGDTVARMGGDEFMLLLPEIVGGEDAARIAQKILEAFREPYVFDGHELRITTSMGIALYPDDGEDGDTLMKNADIAMYRAKDRGRDNCQRYTPAY